MSKPPSFIYWLWAAAVFATLAFFVTTMWSGPLTATAVSDTPAAPATAEKPDDRNNGKHPDYDRHPVTIPPFDAAADAYVLTVWSRNGLTQVMDPVPGWTLLPPGSVLEAQLIGRGPGNLGVRTEGVSIRYTFDTAPEGLLMGADGKPLPREGAFELVKEGNGAVFATAVIPAFPYSGDKKFTPYPLVTVEARDAQGTLLAKTRAPLPVSTEMGCKNCHTGDWRVDGKAGISVETSTNILTVHDRINNTDLLASAKAGTAIDCTGCHSVEHKTGLNLSAAIHGWHAPYLANQEGGACISCHPAGVGSTTRFAEDLHAAKGLNCTRCHGYMEDHALSLLKHESQGGKKRADQLAGAVTPRLAGSLDAVNPRVPWVNLPSCAGCHDFETKPSSRTASSYNHWTKDAGDRFASASDGTGVVRCTACHGAPHALYPVENPFGRDRSNIPPMQYQGVAAPLGAFGNCAACHGMPMDVSLHHPLVELKTRMISLPEGFAPTKPRVLFPHQGHKALDCKTCHHTGYEDGTPLSCSQGGCHSKVPGADVAPEDPLLHRNAFHGPVRGCQPCHLEMRGQGKASGPTQCRACHTVAKGTTD